MAIVRASGTVLDGIGRYLTAERRRLRPYELSTEMQRKLDRFTVTLAVKNMPLEDVVKTLQVQTGKNLVIDPRVHADVARSPILGFHAKDIPLTTALNMIRSAAGEDFVWTARNGGNVIVLSRRELLDRD